MKFLSSDHHFWHANIIKHCARPYADIHEMNKDLISRWNAVVKEADEIYVVGDFMWCGGNDYLKIGKLLKELKGIKHLILGNHDEMKPFTLVQAGFTSVHTSLKIQRDMVWLVHDPSVFCMVPDDAVLLHGHIHTLYKVSENKRCVNVGVDVWEFAPVPLCQVLEHTK